MAAVMCYRATRMTDFKIFISYAKKDTRDLALALDEAIDATPGLTAWVDRELLRGVSWAREIEREIDTCDLFVVLLSPDVSREASPTVDESFVVKELQRALYINKPRKPVLPVMAQPTKPPIEIGTAQYLDVTQMSQAQAVAETMAEIRALAALDSDDQPPVASIQPSQQGIDDSARQAHFDRNWRVLLAAVFAPLVVAIFFDIFTIIIEDPVDDRYTLSSSGILYFASLLILMIGLFWIDLLHIKFGQVLMLVAAVTLFSIPLTILQSYDASFADAEYEIPLLFVVFGTNFLFFLGIFALVYTIKYAYRQLDSLPW